jgi:hypothetical protein
VNREEDTERERERERERKGDERALGSQMNRSRKSYSWKHKFRMGDRERERGEGRRLPKEQTKEQKKRARLVSGKERWTAVVVRGTTTYRGSERGRAGKGKGGWWSDRCSIRPPRGCCPLSTPARQPCLGWLPLSVCVCGGGFFFFFFFFPTLLSL